MRVFPINVVNPKVIITSIVIFVFFISLSKKGNEH